MRPTQEIDGAAHYDPTSPTSGIQEAIDALPESGGRVRLPAGTYRVRQSIWLRDKVSLVGDGPATEIVIGTPRAVRLAKDARKGAKSVTVKGRVPYKVGDAIGFTDEKQKGWHGTHAIVEAVDGKTVRIDTPINRGLLAKEDARAVSLFPGITAEDCADIELSDFTIRGPKRYTGPWWDFTYSAIHLVLCRRARVLNVTVFDWPSDGVGVQRGSDVQVTQCQAHGCAGHGFHPGTGLARSVWSHNIGTRNGGDGFFFCARVHHSVCSDSVFSENGLSGIGGVARGGDHHNVISDNVCSYNDKWGIEATRGDEQVITGNLILGNSRERRGRYPGIRLHDMVRCIVNGNRCADDQEKPTQAQGIVESGESDLNLVSGNLLVGMEEPVTLVGPRSRAEGNLT